MYDSVRPISTIAIQCYLYQLDSGGLRRDRTEK
jgi:hypothetical protein